MGAGRHRSAAISSAARRWAPVGAKGRLAQNGSSGRGSMGAEVRCWPRLRLRVRASCRHSSSSKIRRRRAAVISSGPAGRWIIRTAAHLSGKRYRRRISGGRGSGRGTHCSSAWATHRPMTALESPSVWG